MVGTWGLEPQTSTVSIILGAICYQIATKNMASGFGAESWGIGPFTNTLGSSLSPPRHPRRQQPQQHVPDHQRLVLSRTSHQCVGPLEPVRSPDLHFPTVAFARTDDRHPPKKSQNCSIVRRR